MTSEPENIIVDQYKGMEIQVRAQRLSSNDWQCSIHICPGSEGPCRAFQSVVTAPGDAATRHTIMGYAFVEAMTLCDQMLEQSASMGLQTKSWPDDDEHRPLTIEC